MALAPTHIWAPVTLGGHGITLGFFAAGVLMALMLPRALVRFPRLDIGLILVLTLVPYGMARTFLSELDSESFDRALRHAALFLFSFGLLVCAASIRFSWSGFHRVIPLLALSYAVVVAYGLYQAFARRNGWPFAFLPVTNPGLSVDETGFQPGASQDATWVYVSRASSFFVEPTNFGMFLGYGLAMSLAFLDFGGALRRWGLYGLAATAAGFASNQSLTAVLICGLTLGYYALNAAALGRRRLLLGMVFAVVVGTVVLSLFPGAVEGVTGRLSRLSVQESSGRYTATPLVAAMFGDNPLGMGFAGHARVGEMIHNGAFILILDFGVLGITLLAVWGWWIFSRWRRAVRLSRMGRNEESSAALLGGALVLVHLGILLASGIFHEPMFWVATGLGLAAGRSRPPSHSHEVKAAQRYGGVHAV